VINDRIFKRFSGRVFLFTGFYAVCSGGYWDHGTCRRVGAEVATTGISHRVAREQML
jgi:hypothetical protein